MFIRKVLFGLVALFMVSALIACVEEKEIASLQVDEASIQSNFFIDDFYLAELQL